MACAEQVQHQELRIEIYQALLRLELPALLVPRVELRALALAALAFALQLRVHLRRQSAFCEPSRRHPPG
jgi:hypothetical protein